MSLFRNSGGWFRDILGNSGSPARSHPAVTQGQIACTLDDPWMKRILELADGRSTESISPTLYLEELGSGAGLTDIVLWRGMFDQEVARVLHRMSNAGYISLTTSRDLEGENQHSPT